MSRIRFLLAACFAVFAVAVQADDMDAMIEDCNGCHGDDGVSQWDDVPSIIASMSSACTATANTAKHAATKKRMRLILKTP